MNGEVLEEHNFVELIALARGDAFLRATLAEYAPTPLCCSAPLCIDFPLL